VTQIPEGETEKYADRSEYTYS